MGTENAVGANKRPGGSPPRLCLDCSADISHRGPKALRCESCVEEQNRQRANANYWKNRPAKLEAVKRYQQSPEAKQARLEWRDRNPEKLEEYRARKRQAHRDRVGYNPEGRKCARCGAELPVERGGRAKYCVSCAKPQPRECRVCGKEFPAQGSRKEYCSIECTAEAIRVLEEQGYEKTCGKCGKTKAHTDFGWHRDRHGINRRRVDCKLCEASTVKAYSRALPQEERQARRRESGKREREKFANLPPEEQLERKAKWRRDQYRRVYGPDFDVDELYKSQGGKCAICLTPTPLADMEVDHDHENYVKGAMGSVRGGLCKKCNMRLVARYEGFPSDRQTWPFMNEYLQRGKPQ